MEGIVGGAYGDSYFDKYANVKCWKKPDNAIDDETIASYNAKFVKIAKKALYDAICRLPHAEGMFRSSDILWTLRSLDLWARELHDAVFPFDANVSFEELDKMISEYGNRYNRAIQEIEMFAAFFRKRAKILTRARKNLSKLGGNFENSLDTYADKNGLLRPDGPWGAYD